MFVCVLCKGDGGHEVEDEINGLFLFVLGEWSSLILGNESF